MVKLAQNDIKVIEQYCGYDYAQRCRGILERRADKTVRIVNTGMVSSGKSSLFNTLINSTDEYFPTGAARTTTRADFFDCNNISYIDTPGIDVRSEDDALAFSTIMEADIIIMVHNIRTGPLNRSEVEWLERIVAGMNSLEICQSRLVFVNTWKDTREKDDDYADIVSEVKNKVFGIVGAEIPYFEVSVRKYQNGIAKNKDVLITNSGIQEIKSFLVQYAAEYLEKKYKIDQDELDYLIADIRNQLVHTTESKKKEVQKIQNRVRDNYKSRRNAWQQVYDYFATQRSKLVNLENELRNL